MKMKNRKYLLFIIVIIITFVIMYPYQTVLNDGGSKQYKSLIYEITSYHSLDNHYISGYKNGISIKLFGFLIFEKIEKPK